MTTRVTKLSILANARLNTSVARRSSSGPRTVSGYLQKAVLVALAGCQDRAARWEELAEKASCSKDAVQSAIIALREDGLIRAREPLPAFRRPYIWDIQWDKLAAMCEDLMEVAA